MTEEERAGKVPARCTWGIPSHVDDPDGWPDAPCWNRARYERLDDATRPVCGRHRRGLRTREIGVEKD